MNKKREKKTTPFEVTIRISDIGNTSYQQVTNELARLVSYYRAHFEDVSVSTGFNETEVVNLWP